MEPVRVALFGVSHPHARSHLKTLQLSGMVSEVVLYDADAEALAQVRADCGEKVVAGYSDLEALLDREAVQAGVACFRNDLNGELCLKLIERGVHVISEKPIAASAEELGRVVRAASAAGLKLGVMYQNRYHPVSREARHLVQSGAIGRITGCESRMVTSQVRFRNPSHWLFDREKSGGGILSWLGCHYIDLLCYVSGDEIAAVSALTDTLSGEKIDVEDVASASFRFRSGAIGSLQAGYQLALSPKGYMGPRYDTYFGFRGTDGRVFWDPQDRPSRLFVESAAPGWTSAPVRTFEYQLPALDCYGGVYGLEFMDRFFRATAGDGEPPATGEDALHVARVVEAAYASSDSGRRVELPGREEDR